MLFHIEERKRPDEQSASVSVPAELLGQPRLLVTVEDGKVTKVDGDPNHPITEGKICGRGRMLEAKTNAPERLRFPLKR